MRFVIQQHAASTLHWDLRLEDQGVLVSWAVPKGPSTDPRVKRLAHRVDDHPLDYIDFEGVIPEGNYGAGAVIVWDTGTYRNCTKNDDGQEVSIEEGLEAGHIAVQIEGRKLHGGFALTRFRGESDWLLVKMDDEHADARRNLTSTEPESVLSDRTIDEVKQEVAARGSE